MKKLAIVIGVVFVVLLLMYAWFLSMSYLITDRAKDNEKIMEMERKNAELEKEACLKNGGEWEQIRLLGGKICNLPATDAGKTCTDRSQCEGVCLGENAGDTSGKCSDFKNVAGCHVFVNNGKSQGVLCVD